MQSRPPTEIESLIKRLAYKHVYTRDRYELDVDNKAVMDYDEWQLARFERDFDVNVKDTDPKRVSVDLKGLIEIAIKLNKTRSNYSKQEQISDVKDWVASLVKPLGWFIFRVARTYLVLDPVAQEPIAVPKKLYHFSAVWNKDSILKKGLIPSGGNKYDEDFMYPSRVHVLLAKNIGDIHELAMHIFNHGRSAEDVYHTGMHGVPIVVFEIDVSKLNKGTKFYEDISVKDGAWTYTHIPPQALRVIYEDEYEKDDSIPF